MSRIRRYLVPTLLLLPVIFLCGKLLLTPVATVEFLSDFGRIQWSDERFEVGWPWVFQEIERTQHDVSQTVSFSPWDLIADCGILLTATVFVGALTYLVLCRRRQVLQISLRAALIVVAVIAAGCGWWANERYRYSQDQRWLQQSTDDLWLEANLGYAGPEWLRRLVPGIDHNDSVFSRITSIGITVPTKVPAGPGRLSDYLPAYREFSNLRNFSMATKLSVIDLDFSKTDRKAEKKPPGDLSEFKRIECLILGNFGDNDTLAEVATLPQLRFLSIHGNLVTDAGLAHFSNCLNLETLVIEDGSITDAGIKHLEKLTRLNELSLEGRNSITSAATETLLHLKELRVLRLDNRQNFTDETVQQLLKLPHLRQIDLRPVSEPAFEWLSAFRERQELQSN